MEKIIKKLAKMVDNGEIQNFILVFDDSESAVKMAHMVDADFALYAAKMVERLADLQVGPLKDVDNF